MRSGFVLTNSSDAALFIYGLRVLANVIAYHSLGADFLKLMNLIEPVLR